MRHARVAALLREHARIMGELADAIEDDDDRPSRPRAKPSRKPRTLTRPAGEATPIAAARAAKILRDRGFS